MVLDRYVINMRSARVHMRSAKGQDYPQCNLDDIEDRKYAVSMSEVYEHLGSRQPVRCKRCFRE